MLHWFDPGKYAAFVAGAYGASTVVLVSLVVETLLGARRWRKAAKADRPDGAAPKRKIEMARDAGALRP